MAKINRQRLLQALEATMPGLAVGKSKFDQSTCFCFLDGKVLTYNDEISCRAKSKLPDSIEGAVDSKPLLAVIRKMKEKEIDIEQKDSLLYITGESRRKVKLRMEPEIDLPIEKVERPEKKDWKTLSEHFSEAINIVSPCAGKNEAEFAFTCIHMHPKFIEACQPAGTIVRTSDGDVPIETIEVGQRVWSYNSQVGKASRRIIGANPKATNSFRTGHLVTATGSRPYNGDLVVVHAGEKSSRYTTNHECVVRFGKAFIHKHIVYVMQRGNQFRVGVTGPRNWKSQWARKGRDGRADVRTRMSLQQADRCWILACFATEAEALAEERFVCAKYGIPDMLFRVRPGERHSGTQEKCDSFWDRFGDNTSGAFTCLRAYGRELAYPFVERTGYSGGSRPSHMSTVDVKIRACNLLPGMKVLDADRNKNGKVRKKSWVPITLTREPYNGMVYSMTVEKSHTYIGDGIVTHNCDNNQITRFRLKSKIKTPIMMRQSSIKHVAPLDMTQFAETDTWIHFRNPAGVEFACKRIVEEYPDMGKFLKVSGEPTTLPKGIAEECDFAEIFTSELEKEMNLLVVTIKSTGRMLIRGVGISGEAEVPKKIKYSGDSIAFCIAPKLLAEITKKHRDCQISNDHIRVDGGRWTYVGCLGDPVEEAKRAEAAAEAAAIAADAESEDHSDQWKEDSNDGDEE